MEVIHMAMNQKIFKKLSKTLPDFFTRQEASKHLAGLFKANTLRNIDCKGCGPKLKQRIGRKVLYERSDFVDWLKDYVDK
jgi:hypothetical protein